LGLVGNTKSKHNSASLGYNYDWIFPLQSIAVNYHCL
jgi:hypothetical protein